MKLRWGLDPRPGGGGKNWASVFFLNGQRAGKNKREVPLWISAKLFSAKNNLRGEKNLQISCDAVLDPPTVLSTKTETEAARSTILAQHQAHFAGKQLTPEPQILASFRAECPSWKPSPRPLITARPSLAEPVTQPPRLSRAIGQR